MPSFRVFGEDAVVGLDEVLKQIPTGVEPQDVSLEYAGCGSHDVVVWWGEDEARKPEPEPTPQEQYERLQEQARAWSEKHGVEFP
jgi:hypothetical protein